MEVAAISGNSLMLVPAKAFALMVAALGRVMELKAEGKIRHIGLSKHNPAIAKKAAESGFVEMILFRVNPAFDLMHP